MSNDAPAGDSLTHKLANLRSTAEAIERLAADYHSAIRPVREALQAVADVPLEERDRWAGAVSALAGRLSENGMADVPASLEAVERWDRQFDAGKPGRAFAGKAFCAALAAGIANGSPPDGFYATLDLHPFITNEAATREVCAVLSQLLYVHTERTTPKYTRKYGKILAEAGADGETLRLRLAQCGTPISSEAVAAIEDWDECSAVIPFYHVDIRPTADCATVNDTTGADASNDSPVGPTKPRIPRAEAERLVAAAIANTPPDQRDKLTVRALNQATGVSVGMISVLDSYTKLKEEKAKSVRSVPLTDAIHAVLNDPSTDAADPAEAAADAEVLSELQALATTDTDRTRFEAMTPGERWQMLDLLKEQTADARRDQRRPRRERPDCS